MRAAATRVLPCSVTNLGRCAYASAPPHPIELCYRWLGVDGAPIGAGTWIHTPLPRVLEPNETVRVAMRIEAPATPGRYTLVVTLLQEGIAWFDEVDPSCCARAEVRVEARESAATPSDTEAFYALSAADRRGLTLASIERRAPLLMRWGRTYAGWDEWSDRAALAADWLSTARSVADLGCGAMTLERYLAPQQKYVPVDLVARDERTVVVDLEKDDLAQIGTEACALLGVLEYTFDVPVLLAKLQSAFSHVVASYNVADSDGIDSRLEHGWVNQYDAGQLRALFSEAGFLILRERAVDDSQVLFDLRPRR